MPKIEINDFKTGDMAVYPSHGVGLIEGIELRKIAGEDHAFYILKILGADATIMVPTKTSTSVGLRKIMKKSMIPKVYSILKERKDVIFDNQTWNRRYRDYTEKIKTGCAMEVAKVLRDLYILKCDKELSFGERRMLDTAKNLLVKELSVAKKIKEEKVEEELDKIMKG
ncbi:MAG TPA: CarD family transcriptional regulator [Thermodesulfobacteriota bacterium]|nr:CarD family transcriptional regulator [Thermodesulfobacteriota bacterium]